MRYALCILILFLSIAACYNLSMRLISQVYYIKAKGHMRTDKFGLATANLNKADHFNPHDYKIQKGLGEVTFKLAGSNKKISLLLTQKSKRFYLKALDLNPLDVEAAYGLARGEDRMEELYQFLHPEESNNPYKPLPYYNETVRLRPNGILYQYYLARYLHRRGKKEALASITRKLARIYPPVYHYLKKEDFWTPDTKAAVKQGLTEAIAQDIDLRDAHSAVSAIMAEEQAWPAALTHYQKALQSRVFENKSGNYINLGRLYLKNNNYQEAGTAFTHAVDISPNKNQDLERIYNLYKKEDRSDQFYLFYQQIPPRSALPLQVQIIKARSLIDQQQYSRAKQILLDLNRQELHAESFYWLARIAEKEKDWDNMELAGQKATVLDPQNSQYHLLFSQALKRLEKFERAEKEAGLALQHSTRPNPWLFNHRAWVRWSRKDYQGAVRDWESAAGLKPDRADFYANIAEGYRLTEQKTLAKNYYQKALKLDPDNKGYRKKYQKLHQELSNQ